MKTSIDISVVIPVYKVEKYIERCARSLFEQTLNEGIEFIFIDDCTPDRSIEIIEKILTEYPNRTDQVRIIRHKENLGLPDARYTGWMAAKGEYIANCDSDDWYDINAFETLLKHTHNGEIDIVSYDWIMEFPDKSVVTPFSADLPIEESLNILLNPRNNKISVSLCGRIYKSNLIKRYGLRADRGMTAYEDLVVVYKLYYYASTCLHINIPMYHYNQTDSSSMSNIVSSSKIESSIHAIDMIDKFLSKKRDTRFDENLRKMKLCVKMPYISNPILYDNKRWRSVFSNLYWKDYESRWLKISLFLENHNLSFLNRLYIIFATAFIRKYKKIKGLRREM